MTSGRFVHDDLPAPPLMHATRPHARDCCPHFDSTLAAFPTRTLSIEHIIDLLPVQHAPERVAAYAQRMQHGARFPPVSVVRVFGRFVVADGHKRLAAYRMLGGRDIVVELWTFRRFLLDQWRQAIANFRKNGQILSQSVTRPTDAWRLVMTTVLHWRRVAVSLLVRCGAR